MKHKFQLQDFPNSVFELESSIWTGKPKLFKDNVQVEQSTEKGRPFLIQTEGGVVKAYPRQALPDVVPTLEINGIRNRIVEKLKWFQYLLGGLPILLLFVGGFIGGALGAVGVLTNYGVFRQEGPEAIKYLKVIGVILGTFALYFILAVLLTTLMK